MDSVFLDFILFYGTLIPVIILITWILSRFKLGKKFLYHINIYNHRWIWLERITENPICFNFNRRKKINVLNQLKPFVRFAIQYRLRKGRYPTFEEFKQELYSMSKKQLFLSDSIKTYIICGYWTSLNNPAGIDGLYNSNIKNGVLFLFTGYDPNDYQIEILNVDDKYAFINKSFKSIYNKFYCIAFADGSIYLIKNNIPLRLLYRFIDNNSWDINYREKLLKQYKVIETKNVFDHF